MPIAQSIREITGSLRTNMGTTHHVFIGPCIVNSIPAYLFMCDNRSNKIQHSNNFSTICAHRHIAIQFVDEKCTNKFIDRFLSTPKRIDPCSTNVANILFGCIHADKKKTYQLREFEGKKCTKTQVTKKSTHVPSVHLACLSEYKLCVVHRECWCVHFWIF